jgi:hypothetical protein
MAPERSVSRENVAAAKRKATAQVNQEVLRLGPPPRGENDLYRHS